MQGDHTLPMNYKESITFRGMNDDLVNAYRRFADFANSFLVAAHEVQICISTGTVPFTSRATIVQLGNFPILRFVLSIEGSQGKFDITVLRIRLSNPFPQANTIFPKSFDSRETCIFLSVSF